MELQRRNTLGSTSKYPKRAVYFHNKEAHEPINICKTVLNAPISTGTLWNNCPYPLFTLVMFWPEFAVLERCIDVAGSLSTKIIGEWFEFRENVQKWNMVLKNQEVGFMG